MVAKLRQSDPPLCQLATTTSSLAASCHRLSVPDLQTPAAHHRGEATIEMFVPNDWRPMLHPLLQRPTRVCLR